MLRCCSSLTSACQSCKAVLDVGLPMAVLHMLCSMITKLATYSIITCSCLQTSSPVQRSDHLTLACASCSTQSPALCRCSCRARSSPPQQQSLAAACMAAQPVYNAAMSAVSSAARLAVRAAAAGSLGLNQGIRLADTQAREVVDDIFAHALKKQTGVSLKYMLDFGSSPIERQLVLSSQFLHKELPVRLAHRVAELENLPYGLSSKSSILKVRF